VNDKEKIPSLIHSNNSIASFFFRASVNNPNKWIEENLRRLSKRYPVLGKVSPGLFSIPDERDPVQLEVFVHNKG
jgi:hypothetical protein